MVSVEGVGAGAAVWPLRSCDVENVEKRIPEFLKAKWHLKRVGPSHGIENRFLDVSVHPL